MYWALWAGFGIGKCIAGWLAGWIAGYYSGCQIDRDHQDHAAFGIEIAQNLRFQKGLKHRG